MGFIAGVLNNQAFDRIFAMQQGLIGVGFQRRLLARAGAVISGDHQLGFGIVDPVCQSVGREAAKHHRMNSPDPRTGQHGIGRFGDHRHIQHNAVALGHAVRFQHVGQAAGLL